MKRPFDLILFGNFEASDTSGPANVSLMPLLYALAEEMKNVGKILIVTHYVSLATTPWLQPHRFWNYLRKPVCNKLMDNLWTYTPIVPFNLVLAEKTKVAMRILRNILRKSLNKVIESLEFEHSKTRVAWFSHPFHLYYQGLVGEEFIIYHCYDDFTLLGRSRSDKHIEGLEKKMAQKSNLILATSKTLYERLTSYNSHTYFFSNAVDFELFQKVVKPDYKIAPEIKEISKPIIGFMGNISDWYDYNLLQEIIARSPDWSFVFVGQIERGVQKKVDELKRYPNVHLLGWKNYYLLPAYLKGFDVAIMPYKVNEFMHSVNPDKLYQFMAAELPIVSTPIREVTKFKEIIELADEPDSFCTAIKRSIGEKGSRRVKKGLEIACTESWDSKARMAIRLIEDNYQ